MHTTYLFKRYILVAGLTMILFGALSYGLEAFAGVRLGSALGIITAIVPALDAGQSYARRWEKHPSNAYAWKLSAAFVVLNLAVGAILMLALFAYFGELNALGDVLAQIATPLFATIMVGVLIVYLGASRYFFGFGAKTYLKAAARAHAKGRS